MASSRKEEQIVGVNLKENSEKQGKYRIWDNSQIELNAQIFKPENTHHAPALEKPF